MSSMLDKSFCASGGGEANIGKVTPTKSQDTRRLPWIITRKKGTTMSYENRMYLHMAWSWLLSGMFTILATWIATIVVDLPRGMGAPTSPLTDAPLIVAGIGAIITLSIAGRQFYRLWQWRHEKAEACTVCGCLLGTAYQARWNVGRRCLGCRKFVQTR